MVKIDAAIRSAVDFLSARQLTDGEFPSVVGSDPDLAGATAPDTNYFTTPQVLWSLGFVRDRRCARMIRRAASFVAGGCDADGSWRFFTNKVLRRIDPDTDTTACAAAALVARAPDRLPSMENVRSALLRCRDSDGRFFTWMRTTTHNDVDAVANANVLWFLRDDPAATGAATWLTEILRSGDESKVHPYYESPFALYHAAARACYAGASRLLPARTAILDRVRARMRADGSFVDPLDTAFALCTLCNLGLTADEAVARGSEALVAAQRADGGWAATAVWNGPELPAPRSVWWGGECWTTALCVEALARARSARFSSTKAGARSPVP